MNRITESAIEKFAIELLKNQVTNTFTPLPQLWACMCISARRPAVKHQRGTYDEKESSR